MMDIDTPAPGEASTSHRTGRHRPLQDHPDIIGRLPIYLSTSLANARATHVGPAPGVASPYPAFVAKQIDEAQDEASGSASAASARPLGGPTLHAFQYPILPARQPLPVPESGRARNIKPTMRWKSRNNIVQIELPIDVHPAAYNETRGEEYERGAERARALTGAPGTDAGPSTGADTGVGSSRSALSSRPATDAHGRPLTSALRTSKLGKSEDPYGSAGSSALRSGKLDRTRYESIEVPQQHSDMFVGVIRDGALHLSPLNSTAQLRPTMHYLDAIDDMEKLEKKRARAAAAAAAMAGPSSDVDLSGLSSGDEHASGQQRAAAAAAAQASSSSGKKVVNATLSVRGDGGGDSRRGGRGGGRGGGRFGAGSVGAGADARDALMGAIWDAEAERWVDLEWHDEETREAANFFEEHLFAKEKRPLLCKLRQADYVC